MPRYSVGVARFPGGFSNAGFESPDGVDWLLRTYKKMFTDSRIGRIEMFRITDTPITMGRNRALHWAVANQLDYLVMLDNDMTPDAYHPENQFRLAFDPDAKPFWDSTFDFMLQHNGPCIVAAPYCGPPPHENMYVFQWGTKEGDCPDGGFSIDQYSREQAIMMGGIQKAAALPTGLCMIDVRVTQILKRPWFYYEWKDDYQDEKNSTEDVTFTRDASFQGVPSYCNWDAWAAHLKLKKVGKPCPITVEQIGEKYQEAIRSNRHAGRKMVSVGDGVTEWEKPNVPRGKFVRQPLGNSDGDGDSGDVMLNGVQEVSVE